jgi:hypothetical protein
MSNKKSANCDVRSNEVRSIKREATCLSGRGEGMCAGDWQRYLPQLYVSEVVDEGPAVDSVLGVKYVRHGGVVHDDSLAEIPVEEGEVLHIVP